MIWIISVLLSVYGINTQPRLKLWDAYALGSIWTTFECGDWITSQSWFKPKTMPSKASSNPSFICIKQLSFDHNKILVKLTAILISGFPLNNQKIRLENKSIKILFTDYFLLTKPIRSVVWWLRFKSFSI